MVFNCHCEFSNVLWLTKWTFTSLNLNDFEFQWSCINDRYHQLQSQGSLWSQKCRAGNCDHSNWVLVWQLVWWIKFIQFVSQKSAKLSQSVVICIVRGWQQWWLYSGKLPANRAPWRGFGQSSQTPIKQLSITLHMQTYSVSGGWLGSHCVVKICVSDSHTNFKALTLTCRA